MYTLVSAIGRNLGNSRWTDINIGAMAFTDIYATYAHVIATLSNPFLTANVALDLNDLRVAQGSNLSTFNAFLVANGSNTLPTSPTLPVINPKYARYADAFRAGYKITPVNPSAADDAVLPIGDKPDLHLTRANTDYTLLGKSCLATVNGFYHYSDYSANGYYVKDGMKSALISGNNQMGLLSFRELGNIQQIPITASMLYKQDPSQNYKDHVYLDLGQDFGDKEVFIVIGGYLHVLDQNMFQRIGDGLYVINMLRYPLLDRYYESYQHIDLTSLGLVNVQANPTQVEVDAITSDAAIVALLTLSQSFIVVCDATDLFTDKVYVKHGKIPCRYISSVSPIYPLVVGVGKTANYWARADDGLFSLNTIDTFKENRIFNTTDPANLICVADSRLPLDPVNNSDAYMLQIGKDF